MNSLKEYLQQEIKEEQRLMEAVSKEKFVHGPGNMLITFRF